jgi:hypothetical protein
MASHPFLEGTILIQATLHLQPTMTTPPPGNGRTTYQENQERAYIQHSKNSDRTKEARLESARKASEIHRIRTGKSLRVTEQKVINNEAWYKEEYVAMEEEGEGSRVTLAPFALLHFSSRLIGFLCCRGIREERHRRTSRNQ